MQKVTLRVAAEVGLHARPAAVFVEQANKFDAEIAVRNVTAESDWADAKSILSVLTLGVEQGHEIELEVDGHDEASAVAALTALVQTDFGEARPPTI